MPYSTPRHVIRPPDGVPDAATRGVRRRPVRPAPVHRSRRRRPDARGAFHLAEPFRTPVVTRGRNRVQEHRHEGGRRLHPEVPARRARRSGALGRAGRQAGGRTHREGGGAGHARRRWCHRDPRRSRSMERVRLRGRTCSPPWRTWCPTSKGRPRTKDLAAHAVRDVTRPSAVRRPVTTTCRPRTRACSARPWWTAPSRDGPHGRPGTGW